VLAPTSFLAMTGNPLAKTMQSDAALNMCVALALDVMGPHSYVMGQHSSLPYLPVGIGVPQ
jgi:hypothetical protein